MLKKNRNNAVLIIMQIYSSFSFILRETINRRFLKMSTDNSNQRDVDKKGRKDISIESNID